MRRRRPAQLALLVLLVFGASCSSTGGRTSPAAAERVATLESTRPADAAAFESAKRLVESGSYREAVDALRKLAADNRECATLVILLRRAISGLPPEDRASEETRAYRLFRELEREERREQDERSANLAFACALFAPNPDEELDWLRRAAGRDDRHYFALAKLGERQWRDGLLFKSRQTLERAVSLQRNLAEAWLILAAVEQDSGKTKNAARYYRSYLELRPLDRNVALRYVRLLLHDLQRPDEARPILESLERADPSNLEVGLDIAAMHWLQKDFAKAEQRYRKLLPQHPSDVRLLLNLGNLYLEELDQPAKALQVYRYVQRLPAEARLTTIGSQLLFVPERIRRLEDRLGEEAPPPPEGWRDLL